MIKCGRISVSLNDIYDKVCDTDIINYYFNLNLSVFPACIQSPIRKDNHPSFGVFLNEGFIYFKDFSTGEHGSLIDLLMLYWNCSFPETLSKIYEDIKNFKHINPLVVKRENNISRNKIQKDDTKLECIIRDWKSYDIEYWESFGISLDILKFADVYPVDYKVIIKNGKRYVFKADKYAYAYVERKEGIITLKLYQPFNTKGFKWSNKHDKSVLSLWTKIPKYGDILVICSSLKDALCLYNNTDIPAISVQGEGYLMSSTAIKELNERYTSIYVLFDNDEAGIIDGEKFSKHTGFKNIVLPKIGEAKDISDLYKFLKNKEEFKNIIFNLFER